MTASPLTEESPAHHRGTVAFAADESQVSKKADEASTVTAGPQIKFEEARHDFGTVEPQVLKHAYKFKNIGDKTLEISNVQPGCGCTVVPDYDKKVEPGKEGTITLVVEKTDSYKGPVTKTASVTTNDPDQPSFTLTLRATFKAD